MGENKSTDSTTKYKIMQKSAYMNVLTIDNVTVKNKMKLVLRYFLMQAEDLKKWKKKHGKTLN